MNALTQWQGFYALFGVGAAALLLLVAGIRNSWDSVTYHVFVQRPAQRGGMK
jgi:hypothetical protein